MALCAVKINDMSNIEKHISATLANGAEYLAIGEIIANTGLLASLAPRNNANFDVIVNNYDLSKGCRVEVKHSRSGFKANIRGSGYDFLIFIFAPSIIENNKIIPTEQRQLYVFPKEIIDKTYKGETGTNFNPKKIKDYKDYKNKFSLILDKCT